MQLTFLNWLLALLPVIVVLILMLGLHWGGSKAGAAAWFVTILIAVAFFGAGPRLIAYTQVKAVLLTLDVLYIIWTALLLFHIADEAGAVRIIGSALPRLTSDRMMQGLLLGWLFTSFLQGMGGFGVPVAVAAPLMVGLGFTPIEAVLMACIGHGWAVNFGSLATSFQTLMAVTGLSGEMLAPDAALLLGLASFSCGAIVAYIGGGRKGLVRGLPAVLVLSIAMGGTQYLLATSGLWTLGATGASMVGLAAGFGLTRLPRYRHAQNIDETPQNQKQPSESRSLPIALSAYMVLVVLAFAINLIEPLGRLLGSVKLTLHFPELSTAYGWVTPAGAGRVISVLDHPGAILLYASLVAYAIYARAGYYQPGAPRRILARVARGAVGSSLGIVAMVGMAVLMSHAQMTDILARGLSQGLGRSAYPVVAPFIGALGAFITGSNNNSNVLVAALQMRTAELLGLSVTLILAAQTAGGSLGSIMAPAKVIVGCSTVGLGDQEGIVMRPVLMYGLIPVALTAAITLLLVFLGLR
jgi:lactate permease